MHSSLMATLARTLRQDSLFLTALAATWLVGASTVAAQLPIKTTLSSGGPTGCAAYPPPATASGTATAEDAEARKLIADGQEAALQGEHQAARDAFARAAVRAPQNARVAYYLGREHEALAAPGPAVREYCRYLALSPNAPDGDEVRGRIVRLVPASEISRVDEARANFRSGVALLERHQFVAADSVFGSITRQLPSAGEAFYNRGLSRAARGDRGPAIEDLEKYLELNPSAADRAAIRSTITQLPDRVYSSGQALTSGLIVPGLGQMSTGRPVFGVAVLGGVLGSLLWGMQQVTTTETQQFTDPFGNPYTQDVTTHERQNLAIAAGTAAVLWVGAAVEAYFHAQGTRARAEAIISPSGGGRAAATSARSPEVRARRGAPMLLPFVTAGATGGVVAGFTLSPHPR